jgi:hypothetical protein
MDGQEFNFRVSDQSNKHLPGRVLFTPVLVPIHVYLQMYHDF